LLDDSRKTVTSLGVLTDVFLASDEEFDRVLRGWKRAAPLLEAPRFFTATNPFTGKEMTVRSRHNPDSPHADEDAVVSPDLEQLPRIFFKGTDPSDFAYLAEILLEWDPTTASDEVLCRTVSGPPGGEECIFEIPQALVSQLGKLELDAIEPTGRGWAEKRVASATTITDERARDNQVREQCEACSSGLIELVTLAKLACGSNRRMYLWMGL
jgi:hypothetical protein